VATKLLGTPCDNLATQVPVLEGFEQINEVFFARRDNKFMVFNMAGMLSWRGTEPVTKATSLISDIMFQVGTCDG